MPGPYLRYLYALLVPVVAGSVVVAAVAGWLEPTANDLTRLGGYREEEYGWRSVQHQFEPRLAEYGVPERSYDVVVFGDSFSIDAAGGPGRPRDADHGFWTDWFVQRTGLTVGVFQRDGASAYLDSAGYKAQPPRLVVLEYVERVLAGLTDGPRACGPAAAGAVFHPDLRPVAQEPVPYRRERLRTIPITRGAEAVDYLGKNIPRWLFGLDTTKTVRLHMTRSDLFSSRRPDELLVYADDLDRPAPTEARVARLGCAMKAFQERVERDGRTSFVLMTAPDKSVAYQAVTPGAQGRNLTEALGRDGSLHLLRVDLAIQQAVAEGVQDIYLPSDTHWGEAGKRIAADTLVRYLLSPH